MCIRVTPVRVTIKEIARELGISHSTVSRVLNDKQSALVSESTRDRILQAATRLGYRPSRIAQALKGETTQLIGVFLPDEDNYFIQYVTRSLRQAVERSGYELMLFVSPSAQIEDNWSHLLHWDLDGAFVFDYMFYVDTLQDALLRHSGYVPPLVGLFSHVTQMQEYVAVEFGKAVSELLETLYSRGCRRFGYLGPPDSFHPNEERYSVHTQFVEARGLELLHLPLSPGTDFRKTARETVLHYVQEGHPLPDALFCQNDEMALGAYRALYECGISVPGQVALAGCDNNPHNAYMETPLTSISLPIPEVCEQGWRILQRRIAAPTSPPLHVRLDASLILRASSR